MNSEGQRKILPDDRSKGFLRSRKNKKKFSGMWILFKRNLLIQIAIAFYLQRTTDSKEDKNN
jgi:hypothetical protein